MGKDLKGKELGVGISQRKDGLYTARFTDSHGKRKQQYFHKLQECRKWIADAQFADEHSSANALGDMTVEAWFEYWLNNIKGNNIRASTQRLLKQKFDIHIKPYIGHMLLSEIKPLNCQNVLNQMTENYRISYIKGIRACMHNFFEDALENELILRNPVTKAVKRDGLEIKEKRVLTLEEQRVFLEAAQNSSFYNQYAFVLQTGIRSGELTGLKWSDVDFDKKTMRIQRTATYVTPGARWEFGKPKSKSSERNIPLTNEAIRILAYQKDLQKQRNIVSMEFPDLIFSTRNGKPVSTTGYDLAIESLCKKIGIKKFSMHALRHTFATRCIEAGMKPKTLQSILGHSDIGITMNLYVHVTEEERDREMHLIEEGLKLV